MSGDNGDGMDPTEEEEDTTNMAMVAMNIPGPAAAPAAPFPSLTKTATNNTTTSQKNTNAPPDLPPDPNIANPRLLVNRPCIYERRLPGNAYITAHVQRLQHGFYSSPAVSDRDFDFVDFFAVHFVFHSPNTLDHRFKAATIRASVQGTNREAYPPRNPRFLMHAPHLIYGAVSPETLQWNFSLAGSLGIADMPLSASINPSGGMNGRYKRYEMMRIQGSARTWKSPRGPKFDVEAGEVVWSLEENSLQRSGLPREFSFPMLIQKPRAESRIIFNLDIDPVVQSWYGNYPTWWLSLPAYQPARRRPVDFRRQVGQRFKPVSSERGFNFASLESCFDDYVHMPGRKHAASIPPDGGIPRDDLDGSNRGIPRDFTNVEPIPDNANPSFNPNFTFSPNSAFNPNFTFNPNSNATSSSTNRTKPAQVQAQNKPPNQPQVPNINALNVHVLLDSTTTTTTGMMPPRQKPPIQRPRANSTIQPSTVPTQTGKEKQVQGKPPPKNQALLSGRRRSLRRARSRESVAVYQNGTLQELSTGCDVSRTYSLS
ncbi:hypothetical protein ASPWEDRAFT_179993 [Aspergillus wentii DTO 134E9]|uniref:Uncharacterized protein n=1 Tax=Aspergillus wentii DTO 134E9 TaxID=1073089 RepID=A0A1L9RUA7_ASPWE|nr:uncharacterized protein ASPWEDRAFT_179993 [Aspergillus wentii DTO 134E9]KAI9934075.1 hypothetical protein MW887_005148 [Aspergillus wentii]OJJ38448.1 hypothetical protein ASPWEDRAFT_179993 [Aspergillus wentii DTO 134E9]